MKRAIILSNGNLSGLDRLKENIDKNDFIVCTDGSATFALENNIHPNLVIGDFDSTTASIFKKLKQKNINLIKYPMIKDKTDFELAVDFLLKKKFKEIIVFGILGDRLDQIIANINLLIKIQIENKDSMIKIIEGNQDLYILYKDIEISGKIGDLISIIPIDGDVIGITTTGLEYRLNNETLKYGLTRGISNILNQSKTKISVQKGHALVVHTFKKIMV